MNRSARAAGPNRAPARAPRGHAPRRIKSSGWGADDAGARHRLRTHYLSTRGLEGLAIARPSTLRADGAGLHMTLPMLDGEDLQSTLARRVEPMAEPDVLHIATALAEVLDVLGRSRIMHGALRAEHVLWDEARRAVWLLDFGQARFGRNVDPLAAEQPLTHADDLRELGLLLCELLCGRALQPAERRMDAEQTLTRVGAPSRPGALRQIVRALLNAGSEHGFRSAAAAVDALRRIDPDGALPLAIDELLVPELGVPPDLR